MTGNLFADRESIHPRAFAVRHLIIQDVKFRKLGASGSDTTVLDRVARGVDVGYDGETRTLVVRFEGSEIDRLPLGGLALYTRGDTATPAQDRREDVRHWDGALEDNRRVIHDLVHRLVALVAGSPG